MRRDVEKMPSRCLNRVILIGNLTRDPELKYTPGGMAVCSFGLATNRSWTTKNGEKKEDAQFHRIVSWNKLAELCSQLLAKGRRVFVEGRIQYREFTDAEGNRKQIPEIVIDDMILLDNKRVDRSEGDVAASEEVVDDGTIEDIVIPDEAMDESGSGGEKTQEGEKKAEVEKEETETKKEEGGENLTQVADKVLEDVKEEGSSQKGGKEEKKEEGEEIPF